MCYFVFFLIGIAIRVMLDTYGPEMACISRRGDIVELNLGQITDEYMLDNLHEYCSGIYQSYTAGNAFYGMPNPVMDIPASNDPQILYAIPASVQTYPQHSTQHLYNQKENQANLDNINDENNNNNDV